MPNPNVWEKDGNRMFRKTHDLYQAVIFGAPAPMVMWAWAVWSAGKPYEGVEFRLATARRKADEVIAEIEVKRAKS